MMALRTNLIDADRLIDACRRWAAHKDTSLSDQLLERGWLTPEDRSHVDYLVDRNVARYGNTREAFKALADAGAFRVLTSVNDPELRHWVNETLPGLVRYDADAEQPSRRGPAIGLAAGVFLLALGLVALCGLGGTAYLFSRQRVQMEMMRVEALHAEMEARRQREQAEANFRVAREAVDQMFARAADEMEQEKPPADEAKRQLLENAARYYEEFVKGKDPGDPARRKELAQAFLKLGEIKLRLGDYEEAARAAAELGRLPAADGQNAFDAARLLARCALLADKDPVLPDDKRAAHVKGYTEQALRLLAQAEAAGFFETPSRRQLLEKNKDFDAIRKHQDFGRLLEKVQAVKD
jgi:hypothetical protein